MIFPIINGQLVILPIDIKLSFSGPICWPSYSCSKIRVSSISTKISLKILTILYLYINQILAQTRGTFCRITINVFESKHDILNVSISIRNFQRSYCCSIIHYLQFHQQNIVLSQILPSFSSDFRINGIQTLPELLYHFHWKPWIFVLVPS